MEERQQPARFGQEERIALIACSKLKRGYSCPAGELYRGALFRKSYRVALKLYKHIYILSAKHGLLHPATIIAPYSENLYKFTKEQKRQWREMVKKQMEQENFTLPLVFFTGDEYCIGFSGEKPLFGMKLGPRLSLLDHWNDQLNGLRLV